MKPVCCMCLERFSDYGGLLFSPPFDEINKVLNSKDDMGGITGDDMGGIIGKYHVCPKCYRILMDFIQKKQGEANE